MTRRPYSVTSKNITPFISSLPYSWPYSLPYSFIVTWYYMCFDHIFQLGQVFVPTVPTQRPTCSHPFGRPLRTTSHPRPRRCLKQSKRQPLCSMEPLSRIRTSIYRKCLASHHGLPAKNIESDVYIYVYIYIWYPPKRPTMFDLPIYIYIYCELEVSHQPCWFVMDYLYRHISSKMIDYRTSFSNMVKNIASLHQLHP